jgi:hypothetical protein
MHYAYKDIEFYNRDAIREKLKDFDLKNTVAANLNYLNHIQNFQGRLHIIELFAGGSWTMNLRTII